jgi:hypothetical protein
MSTVQEEKAKRTLRIFLSYTAADRAQARKLRSLLSQRSNLRIFTTEMLSAGEDWRSRLRDELSQCDIFVVLLSSNSVNSPWVLQESGAAWGLNKLIIPIVTHPEVVSKIPAPLNEIQSIEVKNFERPEVVNQILEHYEEMAASRKNG